MESSEWQDYDDAEEPDEVDDPNDECNFNSNSTRHHSNFTTFDQWPGMTESLQRRLAERLGISAPTEIQIRMARQFFGGDPGEQRDQQSEAKDLLVQGRTGTGKSLGYVLLLALQGTKRRALPPSVFPRDVRVRWRPRFLVIVPNAILGKQLAAWANELFPSVDSGRIACILPTLYGDDHSATSACDAQIGAEVLIGTPSLLRTELARGALSREALEVIVVDEADYQVRSLRRFAQPAERKNRLTHPQPLLLLLRELLHLEHLPPAAPDPRASPTNPHQDRPGPGLFLRAKRPRLIFCSATLNTLTRNDLHRSRIIHNSRSATVMIREFSGLEASAANEYRGVVAEFVLPAEIQHRFRLVDGDRPLEFLGALQEILVNRHPQTLHINTLGDGEDPMQHPHPQQGILFCPREKSKSELCSFLSSHGISCAYLSNLAESNGGHDAGVRLWIGSEVDARGLDLPSVSFVIILDPPRTPSDYLHMAGRVGRLGQQQAHYNNWGGTGSAIPNAAAPTTPTVYTILGVPEDLPVYSQRMSLARVRSVVPF